VQRLRQLANSDRPFVQANLADWWIPQISSKSSTEPWTVDPDDGLTYYPLRILREHQQLRQLSCSQTAVGRRLEIDILLA
jgi:hypothetical protein